MYNIQVLVLCGASFKQLMWNGCSIFRELSYFIKLAFSPNPISFSFKWHVIFDSVNEYVIRLLSLLSSNHNYTKFEFVWRSIVGKVRNIRISRVGGSLVTARRFVQESPLPSLADLEKDGFYHLAWDNLQLECWSHKVCKRTCGCAHPSFPDVKLIFMNTIIRSSPQLDHNPSMKLSSPDRLTYNRGI